MSISCFKALMVIMMAIISSISVRAKDSIDDKFTYESDKFAGFNFNYRKAEVGDSAKMVVVYLHGGSGQGDDNKAQMKTPAITDIYNYLIGSDKSFTFLVPQAPFGQQWMGLAIPALK